MSKFEVIQSNSLSEEVRKMDEYLDKWMEVNLKVSDYVVGMFFVPAAILDVLKVFLVIFVGYWVIDGSYSFADFVWVLWAIYVLEGVVQRGVQFFKNLTKDLSYVKKLLTLYSESKVIEGYDVGKDFAIGDGNIRLDKISFWYDKSLVFDKLSLDIAWWKKTAFVWVSGSWKSTLVKLLAWYLQPDFGDIWVWDSCLWEVALISYYKELWFLTQEPNVFDGTVKENLLYALPDTAWVSDEKIKEVLMRARCDFVYDFVDWLETQIWERWVRLSWWQKQRLALAKIFMKDPKIIILDEPTSALDSFSEEAITQAMKELFVWRTVLIIAHRLQTVKEADDIILLEWGEIVERGTHEELVWFDGKYAEMLRLQSGF